MAYLDVIETLQNRVNIAEDLLSRLLRRAYMRQDYREADEIADFLGIKRPTEHEMEDLR